MFTQIKTMLAAGCAVAVVSLATLAQAEGVSGPYLAGRKAMSENDFTEAARYFTRAMTEDPANIEIMESAVLAYVGQGDFQRALAVSRRLVSQDADNNLGVMVLFTEAVASEDWPRADAVLSNGGAAGPLIDGLSAAWIAVGTGDMTRALQLFEKVTNSEGLAGFGLYHTAMALAFVGDFERAEDLLSDQANLGLVQTKHTMMARAQILVQLDQSDRAIAVLDSYLVQDSAPDVAALRAQIAQGGRPGFTLIGSAKDGIAEAFYGVGRALAGETDDVYTLVYSRIAQYLAPERADNALLVAAILDDLKRYDLAVESYGAIDANDPTYPSAQIGLAKALHASTQTNAAIAILTKLIAEHPELSVAHVDLGDMYRSQEKFGPAREAYSTAIDLIDADDQNLWFVYFMRGIAHDKLKDWPSAEADFRNALRLRPDQPQVLNYIGYSYVEMQIKLDEALEMIERAVELRPDSGYITDSLGWVLYRLGRYDEAVIWMEKAAELLPSDPTINDHLGDTLWAVGRLREARFQWSRALSFEPEEPDAARIRRKLEVGLDVVLADEGADPLHGQNDG